MKVKKAVSGGGPGGACVKAGEPQGEVCLPHLLVTSQSCLWPWQPEMYTALETLATNEDFRFNMQTAFKDITSGTFKTQLLSFKMHVPAPTLDIVSQFSCHSLCHHARE